MADTKLSDLSALTSVATGDLFYIVDISDTTDDAAGSSKKITRANLITSFANTFTFGQTIAQTAATGSPISALTVTGAAHTALTASTENIGVNLNMSATKQFATGALTTQREVAILGPTYAFVGASTITEAVTLYVKEPTAGTNATITRKAAIVSEGTVVVRQPGGVSGTDEVQISNDGTDTKIRQPSGKITFDMTDGSSVDYNIGAVNYISFGYSYIQLSGYLDVMSPSISSVTSWNRLSVSSLSVGQSFQILWSDSDLFYSTLDTGIKRIAAGHLSITNGTAGRWGQFTVGTYDAGTNTVTTGLTLGHRSSGTPAAGLGSAIQFNIDSSTTADQAAGRLYYKWVTATHASRAARSVWTVNDYNGEHEGIVIDTDGAMATVHIPMGTTAGYAHVGGMVFQQFADAGNVTTGEDDLYTNTFLGGTFAQDGTTLTVEYGFVYVASATATRQTKVYVAGTLVLDSGALTFASGGNGQAFVTVVRESSTVLRVVARFEASGITLQPIVTYTRITGLTLTNSQVVKCTGEAAGTGAATNDIVAKVGCGWWYPAVQ